MKVDKIEPIDRRRSKVFLDGEFAFALYSRELRHYRIEEGGELSCEQYEAILREIVFKRARERAVYWLKCSARTEEELRRKLRDGHYPERAVDHTIKLLKKYRYIDDEEYARNFVELNGTRKSRAELASALKSKGISRECVSRLLEENPVDEEEQVRKLLAKRRFEPENADPKETARQVAYLIRRGFSYETVRRVIADLRDLY